MDLELKLVTTSPVGLVDGWTKTKLKLTSTQVEVVVEVELVKKKKNARWTFQTMQRSAES